MRTQCRDRRLRLRKDLNFLDARRAKYWSMFLKAG
jgi:hypothetical protein